MDQFTVPQFIEEKAKVIGPMTLNQFAFIAAAGAICFILYFAIPSFFFIIAAIVIMSGGALLAFGKSGGRPLPLVFKNFLVFTLRPRIYLWKKKMGPPPKLAESPKIEPEEIKKTAVPTMVGKSRLNALSKQVETGEQ